MKITDIRVVPWWDDAMRLARLLAAFTWQRQKVVRHADGWEVVALPQPYIPPADVSPLAVRIQIANVVGSPAETSEPCS